MQDRNKKATTTAVYNYSDIVLTPDMESLLNRGLNFCVDPLKLNITDILMQWRKFERKMRWKEFFNDFEIPNEEKEKNSWKKEIFPKEKSNLPPKGSKNLSNFLIGAKSELLGTKPNKTKSNITKGETEALKVLILMQREKQIVIKPCDKGAGIIICNYNDYTTSCEKHLAATTENGEPHYEEVQRDILDTAKEFVGDFFLQP